MGIEGDDLWNMWVANKISARNGKLEIKPYTERKAKKNTAVFGTFYARTGRGPYSAVNIILHYIIQ